MYVDEKELYDNLGKYPSAVLTETKEIRLEFCLFILRELGYPITSPSSCVRVGNFLKMLSAHFTKIAEIFDSHPKRIHDLLGSLTQLIELRSRKDFSSFLDTKSSPSKEQRNDPVWMVAARLFSNIVRHVASTESLNHLVELDEIVVLYEKKLIQTGFARSPAFMGFSINLRKFYVEVDQMLMELITHAILPNAKGLNVTEVGLSGLISTVDKYFQAYSSYESTLSNDLNIRELNVMTAGVCSSCIEFLFKITSLETEKTPESPTIEGESDLVGKIGLKSLISRCKNILIKYFRDEKATTSPMPQ